AADRELSLLADRKLASVAVDDVDLVPGRRGADRPRPGGAPGGVRDDHGVLRLPVALADPDAAGGLERRRDARVERLAHGYRLAQLRQRARAEPGQLRQRAVLVRRLAEHRHAVLADQLESLLGTDVARTREHLCADAP